MKNTILNVKNLNVQLEEEHIIENLSFEVRKGDIFVILGPNGAGKTVLLRALMKLLPSSGEVSWKKGIKIGYVPQRLPYIKDIPLSVREFFQLKGITEKETEQFLEVVGLKELNILDKRMGDLSSGQFQRILVGWTLASKPNVILFDEPFAGIDISGVEPIYNLLERLAKKGLTILLVSHDLSIVYKFATNVLCLNRKMLCKGPPKRILTPNNLSQLYGGAIRFYSHVHD